jgi:hypothetical protein
MCASQTGVTGAIGCQSEVSWIVSLRNRSFFLDFLAFFALLERFSLQWLTVHQREGLTWPCRARRATLCVDETWEQGHGTWDEEEEDDRFKG